MIKFLRLIIIVGGNLYQQQGDYEQSSVEHARLVGWDHVLNINEGVLSSVGLEHFEGLLDEVTQVLALSLGVVDLVAEVHVRNLEQVHDG